MPKNFIDKVSALEAEVKVLQRDIDRAVDELYKNGPSNAACDKCLDTLKQDIKERVTGRLCKNCEKVIRKEERKTVLELLEPYFRNLPSPQNPLATCHEPFGHFGNQDCSNCLVYNCCDNTNPKKPKDK